MKQFFVLPLLIISLLAYQCPAEEALPSKPIISKPFMKLGRGLVNTISSPLELPNQMYLLSEHTHENSRYGVETASAAIEGFFMGGIYTFWRLGAGIFDILSFPFPKYERCLINPPYLTVAYKAYYEKEVADTTTNQTLQREEK